VLPHFVAGDSPSPGQEVSIPPKVTAPLDDDEKNLLEYVVSGRPVGEQAEQVAAQRHRMLQKQRFDRRLESDGGIHT
jgi:hypothetical protein